jgi:hypothetical protein
MTASLKGYYVLCVKVDDAKHFKEIGLALEKGVTPIKKKRGFKSLYWFSTDPSVVKTIVEAGEKL